MTAVLFIAFVAAMAIVVVALCGSALSPRAAVRLLIGLSVWFVYVSVLGHTGVLRDTTRRVPGFAFVAVPVVVFLFGFVLRVLAGRGGVGTIPVWMLLGLQSFRIGVELFLHRLWLLGLVPRMLTFSGANVDLYVGVSAPLVAWLATRGRGGLKLAMLWNVLGLASLANVVTRSVLTAPGPLNRIHAEVPNLLFGTFPYLFIPAFFVPLAVVLHALAMRAIGSRLNLPISVDESRTDATALPRGI